MKNIDKYLLWFMVTLTFGVGDLYTTYIGVSVLNLPEMNPFLEATGIHLSLITFAIFKILTIVVIFYLNEKTMNLLKDDGDYVIGLYYLLPGVGIFLGGYVTYTNAVVILSVL